MITFSLSLIDDLERHANELLASAKSAEKLAAQAHKPTIAEEMRRRSARWRTHAAVDREAARVIRELTR